MKIRVPQLTASEMTEPLLSTWGRILANVQKYRKNERLQQLVEKMDRDLKKTHVF